MADEHHEHSETKAAYGGQAVIEGVMIRGQHVYSVAARHPDGSIRTVLRPVPNWATNRWRRIPFIRGTLVLAESLTIGMRALTYSAQVAAGEEEDEQPLPAWSLALTIATSLGLGIGLFFVLPLIITHNAIDRFIDSSILSNLGEGVLRLLIFFAYLMLVGLMPSIRRVFAYHAAAEGLDELLLAGEQEIVLIRRVLGQREREHLHLVELVHAEDAAGVFSIGPRLDPKAGREAGIADRQVSGIEELVAVHGGERHLRRPCEEQVLLVHRIHLLAVCRPPATG